MKNGSNGKSEVILISPAFLAGSATVVPLPNAKALRGHSQSSRLKKKTKSVLTDEGPAWLSEDGCLLAKCDNMQPANVVLRELSTGVIRLVQLPQPLQPVSHLWPSPDGRAIVACTAKPGPPELWLWNCPPPGGKADGITERVGGTPDVSLFCRSFNCAQIQ